MFLRGVPEHTDVTELLEEYFSGQGRAQLYIVNNESHSIQEVADSVGKSRFSVYSKVRRAGKNPGDDITELVEELRDVNHDCSAVDTAGIFFSATGDTSVGGFGLRPTCRSIYKFLGFETPQSSNRITKELFVKHNYEGRKKLGFDKASRSRWLTDDLWEYTCPVCGKKLVLTTKQIVVHEHGSMCEDSVEDLLNDKGSYLFIQK